MQNEGFELICKNCNSSLELKGSSYIEPNSNVNIEPYIRLNEFAEFYIECKCGNEFSY